MANFEKRDKAKLHSMSMSMEAYGIRVRVGLVGLEAGQSQRFPDQAASGLCVRH